MAKSRTPPPCTAYEGHRRPQTHRPPPRPPPPAPPPPPTKTDTPEGATAEKKDTHPGDPIVRAVAHVRYPTRVEKGTVRGIHGRKYVAAWVEYQGCTILYEVSRHLLFSTPEEAERYREEAPSGR